MLSLTLSLTQQMQRNIKQNIRDIPSLFIHAIFSKLWPLKHLYKHCIYPVDLCVENFTSIITSHDKIIWYQIEEEALVPAEDPN